MALKDELPVAQKRLRKYQTAIIPHLKICKSCTISSIGRCTCCKAAVIVEHEMNLFTAPQMMLMGRQM